MLWTKSYKETAAQSRAKMGVVTGSEPDASPRCLWEFAVNYKKAGMVSFMLYNSSLEGKFGDDEDCLPGCFGTSASLTQAKNLVF